MPSENLGPQDRCIGVVISRVEEGLKAFRIGGRVIVQQPDPFDVFRSRRHESRCD